MFHDLLRLMLMVLFLAGSFSLEAQDKAKPLPQNRRLKPVVLDHSKSREATQWKDIDVKLQVGQKLLIKLNKDAPYRSQPNTFRILGQKQNHEIFDCLPVVVPVRGLPIVYAETPDGRMPLNRKDKAAEAQLAKETRVQGFRAVEIRAVSPGTECILVEHVVHAGVASTSYFALIRIKVEPAGKQTVAKPLGNWKSFTELSEKIAKKRRDEKLWDPIVDVLNGIDLELDKRTTYQAIDRQIAAFYCMAQNEEKLLDHIQQQKRPNYVDFRMLRFTNGKKNGKFIKGWVEENVLNQKAGLSDANTSAMTLGQLLKAESVPILKKLQQKDKCSPQYLRDAYRYATQSEYFDSIKLSEPVSNGRDTVRESEIPTWEDWFEKKYRFKLPQQ